MRTRDSSAAWIFLKKKKKKKEKKKKKKKKKDDATSGLKTNHQVLPSAGISFSNHKLQLFMTLCDMQSSGGN